MKIPWKRVKNHFKVFILGVVLTLGYRAYQQQQLQKKMTISPQRGEDDRPDAPGRQAFVQAEDLFLNGDEMFSGNSDEGRSNAELLGGFIKAEFMMVPKVFCLVNAKRCVFLIKTDRMVAEEEKQAVWVKAQELARKTFPRFPTVAIAFYRNQQYGSLFVGGRDGEYYLRKEGGPFTLYPYFEGVEAKLARER